MKKTEFYDVVKILVAEAESSKELKTIPQEMEYILKALLDRLKNKKINSNRIAVIDWMMANFGYNPDNQKLLKKPDGFTLVANIILEVLSPDVDQFSLNELLSLMQKNNEKATQELIGKNPLLKELSSYQQD